MSATNKTRAAFLVRVIDNYGTKMLDATAATRVDGPDELHLINYNQFGEMPDVRHLADLHLSCYLGYPDYMASAGKPGEVWGIGAAYSPHRIERADQARGIANTLGKIEKGLHALNDKAGYLAEADFAGYLLRVSTILRVPDIYVRNTARAAAMSGETFRKVDGAGLQSWLSMVSEHAGKNEWSALGLR